MLLPKMSEKDRFLFILGQAKYDMNDGVSIPGIKRSFNTLEYETINGVCKYIEKMINFYDSRGLLVKEPYEAKKEE